jgi:predicted AAA+ superfamily ATPase
MYKRTLSTGHFHKENCFLWGPRQTGKSTLLKKLFPNSRYYDLLLSSEYRRLLNNPSIIREELNALSPRQRETIQPVIIDEVQKIPALLDEIQWLIVNMNIRFILCGSSARKLRRGHGNMLGGRALHVELHTLTTQEIDDFSLDTALNRGVIPRHYLSSSYRKLLQGYIGDYLKEEIQAEALTRNIASFNRFLDTASHSNGEIINYQNIARECGVSSPTVKEYYQILCDTLLGTFLPAFRKKAKRRVILAPKFYLFDVGVVNALAKRGIIEQGSELYGKAFEQFIYQEIVAHKDYSEQQYEISYWRTASGFEVDFLLDNKAAIEVKSTTNVQSHHLKGLRALKEEQIVKQYYLVSLDAQPRKTEDGILILPWSEFVTRLWNGEIIR